MVHVKCHNSFPPKPRGIIRRPAAVWEGFLPSELDHPKAAKHWLTLKRLATLSKVHPTFVQLNGLC
jgi:hypothetical protein